VLPRSLAQEEEDNNTNYVEFVDFPYCRCDYDYKFNPLRLSFTNDVNGFSIWKVFVDSSVPLPNPTPCSTSNVGKVEWDMGE
jgi:hypothetical protein